MDKIEIIEISLRSFWFSLASLIPVLGLPFSVLAILKGYRVGRDPLSTWNPARNYVVWGRVLALVGLFISVCCILALGSLIAEQLDR